VSRNGFIGVDKVLPLKTIDKDIMILIISLPCRYLVTYVDSVFLSCSITDSTVHLLEYSFTSTINRGRKRETTGFCCKLLHLKMRSLLERAQNSNKKQYSVNIAGACASG
jgi:hypothetical protein